MWDWIDAIGRLFAGPEQATPIGPISNQGGDLRGLWLSWREMKYPKAYPPGSDAGVIDGIELALLTGELAQLFEAHFSAGLALDERERLKGSVVTLERIVPTLKGDARPHFAASLAIGRWIVRGSPAGSEPRPPRPAPPAAAASWLHRVRPKATSPTSHVLGCTR